MSGHITLLVKTLQGLASVSEQNHTLTMEYKDLHDPPLPSSTLSFSWHSFPTNQSSRTFLRPQTHKTYFSQGIHLYLLFPHPRISQLDFSSNVTSSEGLLLGTIYQIAVPLITTYPQCLALLFHTQDYHLNVYWDSSHYNVRSWK